jgi:NAD(P)-dependent dehydrogenase (short-subunit alcohol dehydrogenase family)
MKGKTVLITGATDGIGKQTAIKLAEMGASVIIHGRSRKRGEEGVKMISEQTNNESVSYVNANLASLEQVKKLASTIKKNHDKLDVLINNAGVFMRGQTFSSDGIETSFAVNHLAHFSLSLQLMPLLRNADQSRIINVSSVAHTRSPKIDFTDIQEINSYIDYSAYSLSKHANILFSNELSNKLNGLGIKSNSLHPGVITTKLLYTGFGISGSPVEEGCKTSVFLASDKSILNVSGKYFVDSKETEASPHSYDPIRMRNLWTLSENITGIRFSDFV